MKKWLVILITFLCLTSVALAGEYDLKTMTSEIQSALDGRRDRYSLLEQFKDQGKIGEGRDGYVVNLTQDADADPVASAENEDRRVIYQAIVAQNNLPETELHTVARVFAETQRSKAKSGQMIQRETGEWVKKR